MRVPLIIYLILLGFSVNGWAEGDSWQLLKRAEMAGNQYPLNGTYVHQMNNMLETFHLERMGSGEHFIERRWSLDGPPREVVRQPEGVTCYAKDKKSLNAAKVSAMHLFPDVLSGRLDDVALSYTLERLGQDRVAQRDCTLVELRPKDKQRFSVRLCLESTTALPLKMLILSPKGAMVEHYAFTELAFGAPKEKVLQKPRYELEARLAFHSADLPVSKETQFVEVTGLPVGFRLLHSVQRKLTGSEERTVRQMVFSDGLVMLSLFIEPVGSLARSDKVVNLHGAIGMATFSHAGQQLTLVGDLPEPMLNSVIRSVKVTPK